MSTTSPPKPGGNVDDPVVPCPENDIEVVADIEEDYTDIEVSSEPEEEEEGDIEVNSVTEEEEEDDIEVSSEAEESEEDTANGS